MSGTPLRVTVKAPPTLPPTMGLIAAAPEWTPGDEDDSGEPLRWLNGWQFLPYPCVGGGRLAVSCDGDTSMIPVDANQGVLQGDPFAIWAGDRCSTFGWEYRDFQGRATDLLLGIQSFEVAAELWTGSLGLVNVALTDLSSDVQTAGPTAPEDALACVEQGLADRLRGRRGMIHVTPQLMVKLVANYHVRLVGGQWISPTGHIVVADAGYDGSGPGGVAATTSQWIYGTSMIRVALGQIEFWPGPQMWAQALERDINELTFYAERMAGYQWDHCGHVAAEVNVAVCDVGGTPGS